jgi:hypothetical protein
MNWGDFRDPFNHAITLLKQIANHTNQSGCCTAVTSSGINTSIPAGFASIAITAESGGVNITLSDGTVFPLSVLGEVFVDAAGANKSLPAYTISGGTWKWHGIK